MTRAYAAEVVTWRYPAPYDCYDMTAVDPDWLSELSSGFHALLDEGQLIGFRSFGPDGQIPGGVYDDSALDTGGGLRPDLTGQGRGRAALEVGLAFGTREFRPTAFRVTVATFNTRALRVVGKVGFTAISRFESMTHGRPYEILVRPENQSR